MSERSRFSEELGPYLDADEVEEVDAVAELFAERPLPPPALRARIKEQLSRMAAQPRGWQPRRPALWAWGYVASGTVVLAVAAIGVAGVGPLGY